MGNLLKKYRDVLGQFYAHGLITQSVEMIESAIERIETVLSYGEIPQVAPDGEGGIAIRWVFGANIYVMCIDNDDSFILSNPSEPERRDELSWVDFMDIAEDTTNE